MKCLFCKCSNTNSSLLPVNKFNHKIFSFKKCSFCNLLYIDPVPDAADLEKMYPPSYQGEIIFEKIDINKKMPGLRFPYKEQLDWIKKFKDKGKVLDYGCGNGHFIYNASQHDVIMDGVEFSSEVIRKLSDKLKPSVFFTVDNFRKSEMKYGVIRLSNVLEHFTNPRLEFQSIIDHLDEGGIVLLEGPLEYNTSLVNWFKWNYLRLRKWLNKNFVTNHTPTHIFFSNCKNQLQFFESFGLKTLCYKVKENTWPYPEHLNQVNSLGKLFKYLIGRISIFIGTFVPRYGNTFLYVGRKTA